MRSWFTDSDVANTDRLPGNACVCTPSCGIALRDLLGDPFERPGDTAAGAKTPATQDPRCASAAGCRCFGPSSFAASRSWQRSSGDTQRPCSLQRERRITRRSTISICPVPRQCGQLLMRAPATSARGHCMPPCAWADTDAQGDLLRSQNGDRGPLEDPHFAIESFCKFCRSSEHCEQMVMGPPSLAVLRQSHEVAVPARGHHRAQVASDESGVTVRTADGLSMALLHTSVRNCPTVRSPIGNSDVSDGPNSDVSDVFGRFRTQRFGRSFEVLREHHMREIEPNDPGRLQSAADFIKPAAIEASAGT